MQDNFKYFIHHPLSNSYFAAKDASEAAETVHEFNKISLANNFPPISRVCIAMEDEFPSIGLYEAEMKERGQIGDEAYFDDF